METKQQIVVVDGEPIVRSVLQEILERDGYQVISFDNPGAAAQNIAGSPPALVITNVSLPGMTGHDAMHLFKKSCPSAPVLMVSGLPDSAVIQHWIQEDGFDAFPKPFTAQAFQAKVKEVLNASKEQRSAPEVRGA